MTSQSPAPGAEAGRNGLIKSPVDFAAGLFLLGIAALGLIGGITLPFGTLSGIGSGLMPRVVAILVGAFGVLLLAQALAVRGERLERWHLRGPVFVLGGVLVFAMVIRGSTLTLGGVLGIPLLGSFRIPPLGLVVAGPLAILVSSLADKDTRPLEVAAFSVIMTLLCGILFKELLALPIPFDPAGLIPEFFNNAYVGFKRAVGQFFTGIRNLF